MPQIAAGSREDVCRRIGELRTELAALGVQSLKLFGSAARGSLGATSDVDLLVAFDGPARFDPFMDLKLLLEATPGRRVDLVTTDALRPALRARIASDLLRVA